MKLHELKSLLRHQPDALPRFILPNGEQIPAHFHLTEVGHVAKKFVDCGGTLRDREACVLQTYVADDFDHRLKAGRLADILELGGPFCLTMTWKSRWNGIAASSRSIPSSRPSQRKITSGSCSARRRPIAWPRTSAASRRVRSRPAVVRR